MNEYNVLKYGATGVAAPDIDFYGRLFAEKVSAGLPVMSITGVPPIQFISDGSPLSAWTIYGNSQQTGTPTPDAPIYPDFVGALSGGSWTVPISCGGQTVTVDLSHTQTVRRVKKLVLDGSQTISNVVQTTDGTNYCAVFKMQDIGMTDILDYDRRMGDIPYPIFVSDHFTERSAPSSYTAYNDLKAGEIGGNTYDITTYNKYLIICVAGLTTSADYTTWLSVNKPSVYYILSTPQIAVTNEPIRKISTYADTLNSADAGIAIPTVRGSNTLTVDTDLQPSSVSITGHIKPL